jgi:hypothetical protein
MNLELQKASAADAITWKSWDVGFQGEIVDERGGAAVDKVARSATTMVTLRYDPNSIVSVERTPPPGACGVARVLKGR